MDKKVIEGKIEELKKEITVFVTKSNNEITTMQNDLRQKVREAQQKVDNLEGRMLAYQEIIQEFGPPAS